MKKFLTLAAVLLLATANSVFAEAPVKTFQHLDRATAERAFEQLTRNAQRGLLAPNAVVQSKFVAIEDIFFNVSPISTETGGDEIGDDKTADETSNDGNASVWQPFNIPIKTGMRVWFELENGTLINPNVYRFSPGEKFFVHVESAVPVFVTLFQHFPHAEGKEPIMRHPDQRFQSSFHILNPAVSTKLPIKFAMDDNYKAEYMSIIVAGADWDGIAEYLPDAAITAVVLERAETQEERDTIHRNWERSIANFFRPAVQDSLVAISKQVDWNWVEEEEEFRFRWREDDGASLVANNSLVADNGVSQTEINQTPERAIPLGDLIGSSGARLQLVSFRTSGNGISDNVDEVATFLFSNTDIGQLQIVLNKVEPFAP
jgi:hypothetical protein